jgi:hypothetical protein
MFNIVNEVDAYLLVVTRGGSPHSHITKSILLINLVDLLIHRLLPSLVLWFFYVMSVDNPADVLTKFCEHSVFWPLIKPFLFWRGDSDKS